MANWSFESGANGDALTGANASSDNVILTGGTAVITTDKKNTGTRAARLTATSTSGAVYIYKVLPEVNTFIFRTYIWVEAYPVGGDNALLWVASTAGSQQSHIEMTPTGAIRFRNDASTAIWDGTVTTSPGTLALNTRYRLELYITRSSTAGQFRVAVYEGNSTTPVAGLDSGTRTNVNTGSTTYGTFRLGPRCSTGTAPSTIVLDDYDFRTTGTDFIGPYGTAPIAFAGQFQSVRPGSTVTLNGSGSTDVESSLTYQWSVLWSSNGTVTLSDPAAVAPTFTAGPEGSVYTFRLTVTDTDLMTSTSDVSVAVTAASGGGTRRVWTGSDWG